MLLQPVQLSIWKCYQCGKELPRGRSDMRFCGPTCRKRHERWLKSLEKACREATICVDKLAKSGEYDETRKQALERLRLLDKRINEHIAVIKAEGR